MKNQTLVGEVLLSKNGKIKEVKNVEHILDHPVDELIDKSLSEFVRGSVPMPNFSIRTKQQGSVKITDRNGTPKFIVFEAVITRGGIKVFFYDLTGWVSDTERDKKKLEYWKNKHNALLDTVKDLLHDIKTPLTSMKGALFTAQNNNSDHSDELATVDESISVLISVLNDISSILGLDPLDTKKITFSEINEKVKSIFEEAALKKGIILHSLCPVDIQNLICDHSKAVFRILINLITNSIEHANASNIYLSYDKISHGVRISVRDDGKGINKAIAKKIFEKNFTTKKEEVKTSGRGLWISKKAVKLIDGKLELQSYGSNTEFIIELPNKNEAGVQPPDKIYKSLEGLKILLIDDNELNLKVLSNILKESGAVVIKADSGRKGLNLLKERPGLIITDIQMPDWDGFKTLQEIQKSYKEPVPPVLAISGDILQGDKMKFKAFGFSDIVSKPVEPSDLLYVINKTIHKNSTSKETIERLSRLPFLSLEIIEKLLKYGDYSIIEDSINEFILDFKSKLLELNSFFNKQDYNNILFILHSLRGSAGTLGLIRLEETLATTEAFIKNHHYNKLGKMIGFINSLFKRVEGLRKVDK